MDLVERALTRIQDIYEFERHSDDEAHTAAVLIGEFQSGNTTEDGLVAVFLGAEDLSPADNRKTQLRKAIERWEGEDGAAKLLPELAT